MRDQIHHLEHRVDLWVDVVYRISEHILEKVAHRLIKFVSRDDLSRDSDRGAGLQVDRALVWLVHPADQVKDSRLACAVLPHEVPPRRTTSSVR